MFTNVHVFGRGPSLKVLHISLANNFQSSISVLICYIITVLYITRQRACSLLPCKLLFRLCRISIWSSCQYETATPATLLPQWAQFSTEDSLYSWPLLGGFIVEECLEVSTPGPAAIHGTVLHGSSSSLEEGRTWNSLTAHWGGSEGRSEHTCCSRTFAYVKSHSIFRH